MEASCFVASSGYSGISSAGGGGTRVVGRVPGDDERAVIMDGLRAYNQAQAGDWDGRPLAVLARDCETKKVVGGPAC